MAVVVGRSPVIATVLQLDRVPKSAPFLHTGREDRLEHVLSLYLEFSALARMGKVRSAGAEIARIDLGGDDVAPLAAFLRALNEDYH